MKRKGWIATTAGLVGSVLLFGTAPLAAAEEPATEQAPTGDEVRVFGQGVFGGGNDNKRREDHDALSSGGGAAGHLSRRWDDGRYLDADGGMLVHEYGTDVDQAEVRVRGGRWGVFSLDGSLRLNQRFYDLAPEEPVPFDPPSDGLDAQNQQATFGGEYRFGDGGRMRLDYRHFEDDGQRNRLKGSAVESYSPFAYFGTAFDDIDHVSDGVRGLVGFSIGAVDLELDGGWADESNRTRLDEVETATGFDDTVQQDRFHAGARFSTMPVPDLAVHGAYRFDRVEGDSTAAQRAADGTTVRESDDIRTEDTLHAGSVGLVARPVPDLLLRAAYLVRSRDREGSGTELRTTDGGTVQSVANRTARDGFEHSPRLSASYSGLDRTRLSLDYRFERSDDDIDERSLVNGAGPAEIDRVQDLSEDRLRHRVDATARYRAARELTLDLRYRFTYEQIDQDVRELVNEDTLGNRERDRHSIRARARYRAAVGTLIDLEGEYANEDYERTDLAPGSSTDTQLGTVTARITSLVTEDLSMTGLVRWTSRDQDVGSRSDRELSIFRDIRFRGTSASGSLVAAWTVNDATSVRGQYEVVGAGGDLENVNHRLFASAAYRPRDDLRLGLGYGYVRFDDDQLSADDYDAHTVYGGVDLTF